MAQKSWKRTKKYGNFPKTDGSQPINRGKPCMLEVTVNLVKPVSKCLLNSFYHATTNDQFLLKWKMRIKLD